MRDKMTVPRSYKDHRREYVRNRYWALAERDSKAACHRRLRRRLRRLARQGYDGPAGYGNHKWDLW